MRSVIRLGGMVWAIGGVLLAGALDRTVFAQPADQRGERQTPNRIQSPRGGETFLRGGSPGSRFASARIGSWNVSVSEGTGDLTPAAEEVRISGAAAEVSNEKLEVGGEFRIEFGRDGKFSVKFGVNADAPLAGRSIRLLLDGKEFARFNAPSGYKGWTIDEHLDPDLIELSQAETLRASIVLDDKELTFFEVRLNATQIALVQLRAEAMRQREPVTTPEVKGICPPGKAGENCRSQDFCPPGEAGKDCRSQ